jgi:hypothetical protein
MTAGPVAAVDLAPGRRTKTAARRPVDLPGRREATSSVLLGALLGLPGAAAVYPVGRMVHFALLGPAWLLLGWAALWEAARRRVAGTLWRPVPSATTARAA